MSAYDETQKIVRIRINWQYIYGYICYMRIWTRVLEQETCPRKVFHEESVKSLRAVDSQ
jgi:hypothetical protein